MERKETNQKREQDMTFAVSDLGFVWDVVLGIWGLFSERRSQMRRVELAVALAVVLALGAVASADTIAPDRLEYQGAFKTTHLGYFNNHGGLAYYPGGDAGNGSLYGVRNNGIVELDIPTDLRKKSDGFTFATLVAANKLQGPTGPGFNGKSLEYLPASRTGLGSDKLFYGKAQPGNHAYCNLDMSGQQGPWKLSGVDDRRVGSYISEIPQSWVDANLPTGQILTTGYDWGQYGYGADLYAYNPLDPAPGTSLPATKLIEYNSSNPMPDFDKDDDWEGSAWPESAADSAMLITGTKDTNNNGRTADTPVYKAWMLFYDPADLAAVAAGGNTYDPAAYATLDVSDLMFEEQRYFVGTAYDREKNVLYATEYIGSSKQIIHVWHIAEPALPIPEPAGLSLIGLALLSLRKRRS